MPVEAIKIYWRPGCSSCAKVKEFVKTLGVEHKLVDITVDADAMQDLARLGAKSVPVVARGDAFTFAQSLDDVAAFLGVRNAIAERLPPVELMARWDYFLRAAQALFSKTPPDKWAVEPAPERTLLDLAYHVFRIPYSFLQCVQHGVEDWVTVAMEPPPAAMNETARLVEYGAEIQAQLSNWWTTLEDKACEWRVKKYDGDHSAHVFLERQVWHTAHHIRQVQHALLDRGVDVKGTIDSSAYDGLPMPSNIW